MLNLSCPGLGSLLPCRNIDSLLERAMQDVESTGLRSEGILAGLGAAPGGGSWLGSPARSVTEQSGGHLRHYDYSSASDLHRPTSRSGVCVSQVAALTACGLLRSTKLKLTLPSFTHS